MATLDEIRLQQLLKPFEGPGGIASLNPLAFQYQDQQYLNQDPTQDFYQPREFVNAPQNFYQPREFVNAPQDFYQPREFVNAPQDFYQPDLTTLRGLDLNRFQGVSDMSIIDETTNDEQDQNYIEQVKKSRNPLSGIMDLLRNIPTPFNLVRRGLESLRGLNNRIQNSDFGQSRTGAEYFMKRRERKQGERARAANADVYASADKKGFTNDRGGFSTNRADRAGTSVGSGQFNSKTSRGRTGY
jgi:hypothetical protein